jgi:hypothetical protein
VVFFPTYTPPEETDRTLFRHLKLAELCEALSLYQAVQLLENGGANDAPPFSVCYV